MPLLPLLRAVLMDVIVEAWDVMQSRLLDGFHLKI
jgi:hypothetical protein